MKEKLKTISTVMSWIFMFAAFLLLAVTLVQAIDHKDSNEPNYIFGHGFIRAISGSMEPYFAVNGIALIQEVDGIEDIAVNDVVTFRVYSDNGDVNNVTHRIIDIAENGTITTKGDNNQVADLYPLTIEHIDSKVVFVCNQTAWVINKVEYLIQHPAIAGCFAMSLVLFAYALHLLFKIRREDKQFIEETGQKAERANSKESDAARESFSNEMMVSQKDVSNSDSSKTND